MRDGIAPSKAGPGAEAGTEAPSTLERDDGVERLKSTKDTHTQTFPYISILSHA